MSVSAQIQQVIKDRGGRVVTTFIGIAPAGVQVDAYANLPADSGTGPLVVITGATATISEAIDTTLTAIAQAGDRQIAVAAASNLSAGARVLLGTAGGAEPAEDVRVLARDGLVVKLAGPLMFRHSAGAALKATSWYYDLTGALVADTFGSGQLKWTPLTSTGAIDYTIDPQVEVLDVVRQKVPVLLAGMTDLLEVEPQIRDKLGQNCDWNTGLANARDELLLLLGPDRHRFSLGVAELRRACALQFVINHAAALGPNHADETKRRVDERNEIVARIRQRPVDTDDDGLVGIADPGDSLNMAATDGPNTDATLNEPAFLGVDDWLSSV